MNDVMCLVDGCDRCRIGNHSQFCDLHVCPKCFIFKSTWRGLCLTCLCAASHCRMAKTKNSEYCWGHTCKTCNQYKISSSFDMCEQCKCKYGACSESRVNGSIFCTTHTCVSCIPFYTEDCNWKMCRDSLKNHVVPQGFIASPVGCLQDPAIYSKCCAGDTFQKSNRCYEFVTVQYIHKRIE